MNQWKKEEWEDDNGYDLSIPESIRIEANAIFNRDSSISRMDSIRIAKINLSNKGII